MNLLKTIFAAMVSAFVLSGCIFPLRSFNNTPQPQPPDYADETYWAALPWRKDSADFQLKSLGLIDRQATAKADVFFIPPTNYVVGTAWNVSLNDSSANAETDNIGCRLLASAYNGSCRVYVPRYRTAVFYSYIAPGRNARKAFALAYEDVRGAFLYYLKHYNRGRPLVIAGHSQGTDYAIRLLRDYYDNDSTLKTNLIAAYLIGRPVFDTTFRQLRAMDSPSQTGGYVTWNSVSYHTNTFYGDPVGKIIGVNPLSWTRDTAYVPKQLNRGGMPFSANRIDTAVVDAKLAPSGFVWVHAPDKPLDDYPGTNTFYYHKDDYAFFYMNIRENVALRVKTFLEKRTTTMK